MAEKVKNKNNQVDDEEIIFEEETGSKSKTTKAGDGQSIFAKYQNYFLGGLVLILAIAFLGPRLGLFGENPEANEQAQSDMINPTHYYEADSVTRAIQMFSDLEGALGKTSAANLLNYYLGTAYMRAGNVAEGVDYLESFKKGDNMVSAAAYAALGSAEEEQGNFEEAAKLFEKASRIPEENQFTTPWFLMEAARCHESAGDKDAALDNYKRIKNDFPASEEAAVIDRYIGRLTGGKIDE